jgi:hypothetical protein
MIHLLDANVLIDANRDYYPMDRVPPVWDWLLTQAVIGTVAMPVEIYEEVTDGRDAVATWLRNPEVKSALVLPEDSDVSVVRHVLIQGYAPDLNDDEVERVGRDPFLIAAAHCDPINRKVVTTEGSRPARIRANRHVPDVCNTLGINHCNTFQMLRDLDFRVR